jgi:signal peptidase II
MKAKKYLWFSLLFVISFALDQGTKIWARHVLQPMGHGQGITVIPGFFDLTYSENPGSAFGLFRNVTGARYLLFAIGILCLGVVVAWLYKIPGNTPWLGAKLGLLAGGAVGNILDRVLYGRVTDFVLWKITTAGKVYQWPVFNIADAALVIGVAMLLLDWPRDAVFKEMEEEEKKARKRAG